MPQSAVRASSQKDLPPSVETAYYRKCIELRRRINDIEDNNDGTRLRIQRLNRGVQKMRLERAFLLEQLHKHMEYNADDSDRSSSPPPTPTDKPLRSKRSHRKGTPPPGGHAGSDAPNAQGASPEGDARRQQIQQSMLTQMSSAQSTPDPSRANPFFSAGSAVPASPRAVNGDAPPNLPSLNSLAPSSAAPLSEHTRGAYFDPAYDERPGSVDDTSQEGRRRAYSGARPAPAEVRENGDTEMADASTADFASINRTPRRTT